MLIKTILLFLIAMGVLALFGRLRFPRLSKREGKKTALLAKPEICPRCGRYQIGKTHCDCQGPNKGS